ncbi:MAG: prolipoprotein diacylglyceryl transferase [Lachnospiraceae bacterium]|nr:prolipoprotein diacylglyceryl transferase [Lachnospiraceae bacterium]
MKNELFSIGPVTIYGYGLMIGLGVLFCILMGMQRAKKHGLKEEAVIDIAIYGLIIGFLGAKLLYVIVEWEAFLKNPMSVLGTEGFVVYGGISAGVIAAIVYCRIKKLKFLEYFDLLSASIALAQGFGRIGCFLAGCCYGRETDSCLGVVFPAGSIAPAGVKVLPTQLFSSAGDFAIMAFLLWHYKRRKYVGDTGFLYMLLYGIGRFFIEMLRNDNRGAVGALSTSQFISIFIVTAALLLLWNNRKRGVAVLKESEQ